ncbi:hypothetical protein TNCV_1669831 [Trichonephila clavipes]|nr:hypothetical protein TNCV_1669831 [Trichonephila clavipes]
MFLYLQGQLVQVTGPRSFFLKKKGPRMNVAVNPHQTVTFRVMESLEGRNIAQSRLGRINNVNCAANSGSQSRGGKSDVAQDQIARSQSKSEHLATNAVLVSSRILACHHILRQLVESFKITDHIIGSTTALSRSQLGRDRLETQIRHELDLSVRVDDHRTRNLENVLQRSGICCRAAHFIKQQTGQIRSSTSNRKIVTLQNRSLYGPADFSSKRECHGGD